MTAEVHERLVLHEWLRGAAQMDHRRPGPEADFPTRRPRAAAPVDILVVDEESFVEATDLLEAGAAHQQEAAAHPVHIELSIGAPRDEAIGPGDADHARDLSPRPRKRPGRRLLGSPRVGIAMLDAEGADIGMR